jgi:hypothetical protein
MNTTMSQLEANQQAGMNLMNSFGAETSGIFLDLGCEEQCVGGAMTNSYSPEDAMTKLYGCCNISDYVKVDAKPSSTVSADSACFMNKENQVACVSNQSTFV